MQSTTSTFNHIHPTVSKSLLLVDASPYAPSISTPFIETALTPTDSVA